MQVSQRAYNSLVDILSMVCASYFTVKLSRYTMNRVLGMEQPHYERYLVCPNGKCRQLYDWCPACGLTWPYVQPVPAHQCAAAAPVPAADCGETKADGGDDTKHGDHKEPAAPIKESKEARRKRLGQVCAHVRYPDHPTIQGRDVCGRWLFKQLERPRPPPDREDDKKAPPAAAFKDKKKDKLRSYGIEPCVVYCYRPVSKRLAQLLCRPDVEGQCEEWRARLATTPPGVMVDIYNGRMWHKFQQVRDPATGEEHPFLSLPGTLNLAFTINVDWLQRYLHVVDSVGVV